MQIGAVVKLKQDVLGNLKGTLGVCYEEYNIGHKGCSFIFENGNYDGFSEEEQERFLEEVGFDEKVSKYKFSGVIKLSNDFIREGMFSDVLIHKEYERK